MPTLFTDTETFSLYDLPRCGVYRYSEKVEVLIWSYALDDGPVRVWDRTAGSPMPDDLHEYIHRDDIVICAHNSNFDRTVLRQTWPHLNSMPWRDTMVRALQHGLPGSLGELSLIFKLKEAAKDTDGRRLVMMFCKIQGEYRKVKRCTRLTHPEDWAKFVKYAGQDIVAMRALDKVLPRWNDTAEERALWLLDQKINDRGFAVDKELAECALKAVIEEQKGNAARTHSATEGVVGSATQRDALLKYILEIHGVDLPDMQTSTLTRRLEDPDLPQPVKDLIALRLQSAGTSTSKFKTVLSATCEDGRLRGTLQFRGASRTGRASGRIFQPQNLPKPYLKVGDKILRDTEEKKELSEAIEMGIGALKAGCADLMFDSVIDLASSAVRGIIVAPQGFKLVIADLAAIEGRVLAWLAGEEWKLQAYRDLDAGVSQYDMYKLTYAKTFSIEPSDVTKDQRQLGKVLELALGFGGGCGAFVTFAKGFNINLEALADTAQGILPGRVVEEAENFWEYSVKNKKTLGLSQRVFVTCDSIKRMWREANPAIARFWKCLEQDARSAIQNPGTPFSSSDHVTFVRQGAWLRGILPSGRNLCYCGISIDDEDKIRYYGINQYSRKWCKLHTYSGKLAENLTQAMANDVLHHGMQLAEAKDYAVVLHVHDELITEVPDNDSFSSDELSKIMSVVPAWAPGLPLNAAGFESYRYRKD